MLRSLYAGVSGVRSYQFSLDVIADNIANVNTTGYKAARTTFRELYSQLLSPARRPTGNLGGVNPRQVGLGVSVASTDTLFAQGAPQATGRATDLAINGNGFFILTDGQRQFYTRSGVFSIDSDGNLVYVNGMQVMGWNAVNGQIQTNRLEALKVPPIGTTIPPKATSQIVLGGVVDSRTTGSLRIPEYSLTAADGTNRRIQFEVTPTGNFNEWNVQAKWTDTGSSIPGLSGTWRSDASGVLASPATASTAVVGVGNTFFSIQGPAANTDLKTQNVFTVTGATSLTFSDLQVLDASTPPQAQVTLKFIVSAKDFVNQRYVWEWKAIRSDTGQVVGTGTLETDTGGNVTASGQAFTFDVGGTTVQVTPPPVGASLADATDDFRVTGPAGWSGSGGVGTQQAGPVPQGIGATFLPASPVLRSVEFFDSLGNRRNAVLILDRQSNSQWNWTLMDPSQTMNYGAGTLTFAPDGSLSGGSPVTVTVPGVGGANATQLTLDLSKLLQVADMTNVVLLSQDGYATGKLDSIAIDDAGFIKGSFSNGVIQDLGQVALATFANQEGLIRREDTLFEASPNVGAVNVGAPGSGNWGSLAPGFLEMSNVDLSQEFSALIAAQRALQANSRIVTVSDEVLQEVVNLKR